MEPLGPVVEAEVERQSERLFWRQLPLILALLLAFFVLVFYFGGGGLRALEGSPDAFSSVGLLLLNLALVGGALWVGVRWWGWVWSGEPLHLRQVPSRRLVGVVVAILGLAVLYLGQLLVVSSPVVGLGVLGAGIVVVGAGALVAWKASPDAEGT